jgi:serine/threonine protein kinase
LPDYIHFEVGQSMRSISDIWYKCVQHLGTGGNAVTFLVLATSGQNEGVLFALKIFRKLSQPERRRRFLAEVKFLQTANHPALMRVFDSGVFAAGGSDFPFVVAEYLPQRLADLIRAGDATTARKISYSLQLLSGLTYLATLTPQVVHRDIRPQNIFVKGGSSVLGDFGLMKLLDGNIEQDREIFKDSVGPGMPFFYRTPDLIAYAKNEADVTTKSDVFQLGLVLAELFTGRNPAKRTQNHLDPLELEPLGTISGGLSAGISNLINRMLTTDPGNRPEARDLLDPWQGVFGNAVERAHALDGRAI